MNIENRQAQFNHEEWIENLYKFLEMARQFFKEVLRGIKALSQKGLAEAWKDIRSAISKLTPKDFIVPGILTMIGLGGFFIFMVGLSLLTYQSILWLQNGFWTEFPLFVVFNFLFENTAFHLWVVQPESWMGLQKLFSWFLENIPLSIALMVPGLSLVLFMAGTLMVVLLYRFFQLKNRND